MKVIDLGPDYDKIAALVVEDGGGEPDGLYLYIEADSGVVSGAIFRDAGDKVYYVDCSTEIFVTISNLWEGLPPEQQWSVMHMDIKNGKFDARFDFIEGMADEDEDGFDDREDAALAARFGDKEIVYPDD